TQLEFSFLLTFAKSPPLRPLSFTRNIGGLENLYRGIRRGYSPGVSVSDFRRRSGLGNDRSWIVTEFFLCTQVRDNQEYIIGDTLVAQPLGRTTYGATLARLSFFALNLNMPGERLNPDHRNPAEIQHFLSREHLYSGTGWRYDRFDKDSGLEPAVRSVGEFK